MISIHTQYKNPMPMEYNQQKKDEKKKLKNELNITLSFAGNCTKSKCTHQIHLAAYIDSKKFKVLDNSSRKQQ